jgi:hypothetical protein
VLELDCPPENKRTGTGIARMSVVCRCVNVSDCGVVECGACVGVGKDDEDE